MNESGPPPELSRWTGFLLAWVAASGNEHYARRRWGWARSGSGEAERVSEQASAEFFAPLTAVERDTFHGLLRKLAER